VASARSIRPDNDSILDDNTSNSLRRATAPSKFFNHSRVADICPSCCNALSFNWDNVRAKNATAGKHIKLKNGRFSAVKSIFLALYAI